MTAPETPPPHAPRPSATEPSATECDASYVRFQGTVRSPRGHFPGVFALANNLERTGALTAEQWRFWRTHNDWYDTNYTNPSTVDPTAYDQDLNPGAVAWFKPSAGELIQRVAGYLEILAAHGIECATVRSPDPGRIVYEDEHQIVVVPHATERRD
ncbi:hypothetical protein ACFY7Z_21020 [Streptomyces sp. NPDC012623]|uniref:hypothetical protein n=1 Tax=unclassified Streptomyces TaxID=2593676 RepID=UPI0036B07AFD